MCSPLTCQSSCNSAPGAWPSLSHFGRDSLLPLWPDINWSHLYDDTLTIAISIREGYCVRTPQHIKGCAIFSFLSELIYTHYRSIAKSKVLYGRMPCTFRRWPWSITHKTWLFGSMYSFLKMLNTVERRRALIKNILLWLSRWQLSKVLEWYLFAYLFLFFFVVWLVKNQLAAFSARNICSRWS